MEKKYISRKELSFSPQISTGCREDQENKHVTKCFSCLALKKKVKLNVTGVRNSTHLYADDCAAISDTSKASSITIMSTYYLLYISQSHLLFIVVKSVEEPTTHLSFSLKFGERVLTTCFIKL